jgi:hypothetical protein
MDMEARMIKAVHKKQGVAAPIPAARRLGRLMPWGPVGYFSMHHDMRQKGECHAARSVASVPGATNASPPGRGPLTPFRSLPFKKLRHLIGPIVVVIPWLNPMYFVK